MDVNVRLSREEIKEKLIENSEVRKQLITLINESGGATESKLSIISIYNAMVELLNESVFLADNNHGYSLPILLRSQSELFANICFILKSENIDEVGKYYFYWSKYKNHQVALKSVRWSKRNIETGEALDYNRYAEEFIKKYVRENVRKRNKKYKLDTSSSWLFYEYDLRNTRMVFKCIGYEEKYHTIFAMMSSMVHSSGVIENSIHADDKEGGRYLSSPLDPDTILSHSVYFLEEIKPLLYDYMESAF